MKLSTGMIGTLLFTAVATAAFVWMAKRPAVDGNAMIFGMPASSNVVEEKIDESVEDKIPEAIEATTPTSETTTAPATSMPEAEPAKVEETTTMPASTETEVKTEEMPTVAPEAPATESTGSTTN